MTATKTRRVKAWVALYAERGEPMEIGRSGGYFGYYEIAPTRSDLTGMGASVVPCVVTFKVKEKKARKSK